MREETQSGDLQFSSPSIHQLPGVMKRCSCLLSPYILIRREAPPINISSPSPSPQSWSCWTLWWWSSSCRPWISPPPSLLSRNCYSKTNHTLYYPRSLERDLPFGFWFLGLGEVMESRFSKRLQTVERITDSNMRENLGQRRNIRRSSGLESYNKILPFPRLGKWEEWERVLIEL